MSTTPKRRAGSNATALMMLAVATTFPAPRAARVQTTGDDRSLGAQAIGNLGLFKAPTQATLRWDQFRSFGGSG